MLLFSSYFGAKVYVFNSINKEFPGKIEFSDLSLSVFPLGIQVRDIDQIHIKNKNLISFKSLSLEIPFWSLLSRQKEVKLIIHDPKILFNDTLFDQTRNSKSSSSVFRIKAIKIISGELLYATKKLSVNLTNFNLDSLQFPNYTTYQMESPFLRVVFPMEKKKVAVEGTVVTKFKQHHDGIKINKFYWSTKDFRINAHGSILHQEGMDLNAFFLGNPEHILYPLLEDLTISGMIYGNSRITVDKDQKIFITGRFNSRNFSSGGHPFTDLQGRLTWDSVSDNIKINTYFMDNQYRTNLKIDALDQKAKVLGWNISGNSLSKVIDIYRDVPIGGIVEQADILINKKIVSGTVLLKPQPGPTPDFNVRGQADFRYDIKQKIIDIHSNLLSSEFGNLSFTCGIIPPQKRIDLSIQSRITEMGEINKYSKYFINLDFEPWRLRKGNGDFTLKFNKWGGKTVFLSTIDLKNFLSQNQSIAHLSGLLSGENESVLGNFEVKDPFLKGKARLLLQKGNLKINFARVAGPGEKILALLDIDAPISGPIKGEFSYTLPEKQFLPLIEGDIFSDRMTAYGIHFDQFSGKLRSNLEFIDLKNLSYRCYNGNGNAEIFIDFKNKKYKLGGVAENIKVNRIQSSYQGTGRIAFSGEGNFRMNPLKINYQIKDFSIYPERKCDISGQANVETDFSDYEMLTIGFIQHDNRQSPFNINLNKTGEQISGIFKIHLKDINYIMPWKNNQGRLTLNGQIKTEESGKISLQGIALFNGEVLVFPNFPHTLRDFKALVTFKDMNFTLSSLQGSIANGEIESNGFLILENNKIKDLQINLIGKKMNVYLIDKTSGIVNADLMLQYLNQKLLLKGNLNILSMLWERELDEGIEFYTQPESTKADTRFLNLLQFDINLVGRDNIRMVNSFGNISCSCDLKLTGDYGYPILTGKLEAKEGEVYFSDRTFNLIKGKMVFNNRLQIDPIIDLQSEEFIKNYRIRFNIKGSLSQAKPEFQSSPPLPLQDILALLSLGELFKRPTSTELSSQITTTGMITTKLTENLEKRIKKIFGIDLIKIDPMVNGISVEGESRVSVGKAISKNLIIVYSTNISTSRQEILYLLYQVSPAISIIGMRNEEGRYSIDIRLRKRR